MAIERYAMLPGWRRPLRFSADPSEHADRERMSLREAVLDVVGYYAVTSAQELRAAIREDWGHASDKAIDRERDELARDGELARVVGGWVRVEADEDGEAGL